MKKENQCVTVRQRAGRRLRVVRGRMFTIISIHDYRDTDNSPFSTYCECCLLRSATKPIIVLTLLNTPRLTLPYG